VYDRGNSGVPEGRDRNSDVGTRREKTGIEPKERKEGAGCATRREKRSSTMWNGCGKMRQQREGTERGEIQNEEGREIGWMKEIWKRRDRMEKERGGV
jgi:hypothetical protein